MMDMGLRDAGESSEAALRKFAVCHPSQEIGSKPAEELGKGRG